MKSGINYIKSNDGTQIYLEEFGKGKPVIFVHGWTMSHSIWERQVHDLADRFRVVAFDNRGHGDSDKPNSNYDFDEFSSDLRSVLEQLDLSNATLVGWSMGVSISLRYLERYGDDRVSKLVLINGPIKLVSSDDFPYSMSDETVEKYFRERIDNRPMRERQFISSGFFTPHPEAINWLTEIAMKTPMHIAMKCVKHQAKLDMRNLLSRITIPVLVEYGRHDPFYPVSLGEYVSRSIRDSKLVIFENSGHYPFLEESEQFNKELSSFLDRTN